MSKPPEPAAGEESPPTPTPEAPDLSKPPAPSPEPEKPVEDAKDEGPEDAKTGPEKDRIIARIRQLKEQRKQLRAALGDKDAAVAALSAQVEALQAQIQSKPATPSFDKIEDPQVLETEVKQAKSAVDWAQDALDGFAGDEDVETMAATLESSGLKPPPSGWTAKSIRQMLVGIRNNARATVQAGEARRQWLETEARSLEFVSRVAPTLGEDPTLTQEVEQLLTARPWIKQMPDWSLVALTAVLGMRQLQQPPQAAPKPATVAKPVPVPPPRPPAVVGAPRSAPAAKPDGDKELRERATRPGASREDRVAYMKAQFLKG